MEIRNYSDFVTALRKSGFSMSGGATEGIFALIDWSWTAPAPYDTPVRWHTGDIETDPWEWRMRVLDEEDDIAYAKFFFKKTGFITREWYPYFLAVRRGNAEFEQDYMNGKFSRTAKCVYEILRNCDMMPADVIKKEAAAGIETKTAFEKALIELQMKFYITMCGRRHKVNTEGEQYGWASSVFCTVERFWGDDMFERASKISVNEAVEAITEQVFKLNPTADPKKVTKFITG